MRTEKNILVLIINKSIKAERHFDIRQLIRYYFHVRYTWILSFSILKNNSCYF